MIVGTGIDVIEVDRIAKAIKRQTFRKRVFTVEEQRYCDSRGVQGVASYAARFAAKEAVLKAFGTGLVGGTLLDIEIIPDTRGCPQVKLTGYFAQLAEAMNVIQVHISLTHTRQYAAAQAVLWGGSIA